MMRSIALEFAESFYSPSSVPIKRVANVIGYQFWVAVVNEKVVGTIGFVKMKNKSAGLKSLFVAKEHRGGEVTYLLLQKYLNHAKRKSIRTIYLGTMEQMKGAHKFYEKNGFKKMEEKDLPKDFNKNPVDVVFYRKQRVNLINN